MISNLLVEYPWLTPAALVLMVVLGPWAASWLVSRATVARYLAAGAMLPVALLTLVPVDRDAFARCTVGWTLPTPDRVESMANLVLFVGPALFAAVATRRPVLVLAGASGLSVALEVVQALSTGLGRSCDTTDWLSNTLGAVIGVGLAVPALYIARCGRAGAERERPT